MRQRSRPSGATTIAVFHIIFGGLGMFWHALRVMIAVFGASVFFELPGTQDLNDFIEREVPSYHLVHKVDPCLSFAGSVLMVIVAIGLLNNRNWARVLGLVSAFFSLLFTVGDSIYYFLLVVPSAHRAADQFGLGNEREFIVRFEYLWTGFFNLAALVYFGFVVGVLLNRAIGDFYRGSAYAWTEDW